MMGLKDRIEEEMVVNTESILEKHFDRARELFELYEDGTIAIAPEYQDSNPKESILIYLIAQHYRFKADRADSTGLPYQYFYDRLDKNDSTVRHYFSDLSDDGFVRTNDEGHRELVVERLPAAMDRITGSAGSDE